MAVGFKALGHFFLWPGAAKDAPMKRSIYLRPLGLFPSPPDDDGDAQVWGGLPLANTGLGFSAIEIIEREDRSRSRRIVSVNEVFEREWGRHTAAAADLMDHHAQGRPRIRGLSLDRPRIMGIVNLTPDSFSDGGQFDSPEQAVAHGLAFVREGADILDLGAESTRPGSDPVPEQQELKRLMPVLEGLRAQTDVLISVDTRKAAVMRAAIDAGADILNDVSALTFDDEAMDVVADSGLPVVLMHAQGDPKTMQDEPHYDDALLDVFDFLEKRIGACVAAGIARSRIIADPGFGFGKTLQHNLELLAGFSLFHGLGVPVLAGLSRKRMIGALTGVEIPSDRVAGSVAGALSVIAQGAQIVRVHDVVATKAALDVWRAGFCGGTES